MIGEVRIGNNDFYYHINDSQIELTPNEAIDFTEIIVKPQKWYVGKRFVGGYDFFGGVTSVRLNNGSIFLNYSKRVQSFYLNPSIKLLELKGPAIDYLLEANNVVINLDNLNYVGFSGSNQVGPTKDIAYMDDTLHVRYSIDVSYSSFPYTSISTVPAIHFHFSRSYYFKNVFKLIEKFREYLAFLYNTQSISFEAHALGNEDRNPWSSFFINEYVSDHQFSDGFSGKIAKYIPNWEDAFAKFSKIKSFVEYIPLTSDYELNASGLVLQFSLFEGLLKGNNNRHYTKDMLVDDLLDFFELNKGKYISSTTDVDAIRKRISTINSGTALIRNMCTELSKHEAFFISYIEEQNTEYPRLECNSLEKTAKLCHDIRNRIVHGDSFHKLDYKERYCYKIIERLNYAINLQRIGVPSDSIGKLIHMVFKQYK